MGYRNEYPKEFFSFYSEGFSPFYTFRVSYRIAGIKKVY